MVNDTAGGLENNNVYGEIFIDILTHNVRKSVSNEKLQIYPYRIHNILMSLALGYIFCDFCRL